MNLNSIYTVKINEEAFIVNSALTASKTENMVSLSLVISMKK